MGSLAGDLSLAVVDGSLNPKLDTLGRLRLQEVKVLLDTLTLEEFLVEDV